MSISLFAPARRSRRRRDARLLVVSHGKAETYHSSLEQLGDFLHPGDVLVVNDAATMPSSFLGVHRESQRQIELRLASNLGTSHADVSEWLAVVFGEGDWHDKTEERPAPPQLRVGDTLTLDDGLRARISMVSPQHSRLVSVVFEAEGADLWRAMYQAGRPIQYSYLEEDLQVWDQQTIFAGPPIAVEPPSAGFHMTWALILSLKRSGVAVIPISHATGLSTTGDDALDRLLPFPERSYISAESAAAINGAKRQGRQVIALGTGVTRALESAVLPDLSGVASGAFVSRVKLHPTYPRSIVDGLFTGLHDVGSSHMELLGSFVDKDLLHRGYQEAQTLGYLGHEYGDTCLIAS